MDPSIDDPNRFKTGVSKGLSKGWSGFIWLLKIILPVSFATGLLVHLGLIYKLDFLLTPLMNWMGLPASAALVLVAGIFTGIYGTVAAMSSMPFSMDQMILMAVFTLMAHNLIQESLVQGNSGINPVFAALFRLFSAFGVTFVCARVMGVDPGGLAAAAAFAPEVSQTFGQWLSQWGMGTLKLIIQIFCIIMPLMVMLEWAKLYHVIPVITRIFSPVLSLLGLDRSTGMLWLTAAFFGLAYGSAVIVEETRNTEYDRDELTKLHLSVGINHAMIEDPALFLPLGIPPFWLWIPRLIAAMIAVYLFSAFSFLRRRYAERAGHQKIRHH
ncbi:MAG: nucleoside recognition domain-containing protein [Desulfobacterales bacterium]|nr:nucleoside recognition domain-containing protein [Desulfobacterales bacterium]